MINTNLCLPYVRSECEAAVDFGLLYIDSWEWCMKGPQQLCKKNGFYNIVFE